MLPEDEQKMEIGQAMGKSFMIALFGIFLALAEEEASLFGVGIAVLAGVWFYVSLRRLMALTARARTPAGRSSRSGLSSACHSTGASSFSSVLSRASSTSCVPWAVSCRDRALFWHDLAPQRPREELSAAT